MRRLSTSGRATVAVVALSGFLFAACDSESDENEDPFVGTWTVSRIELNDQDYTGLIFNFSEIDTIGATFSSNGAFELFVITAGERVATTGAYTLGDDGSITLSSDSFEEAIELDYEVSGSNTVVLTAVDATLISELSGVDLSQIPVEINSVALTIRREN